jgi:hypothetical protein
MIKVNSKALRPYSKRIWHEPDRKCEKAMAEV